MAAARFREASLAAQFTPLLIVAVLAACQDGTAPSVPAAIEVIDGDGQYGLVASVLPRPVTVRVVDGRGRPVAGTTVRWLMIAGYGSANRATSITSDDGTAEVQWTLGTLAGDEVLAARIDGTDIERRIAAEARPGAPATIHAIAGDRQAGQTGEALPAPLVVRVADAYGNGIPELNVHWSVTVGDGSLSAPSSITDTEGRASVHWTLGQLIGEQSVQAAVGEVSRTLTALGASANFNLVLESVHLNQAVQNDTSGVGGVARRPGLLRITVRATDPNTLQPPVLVQFHVPGRGLVRDTVIDRPASGVPTDPRFGTLADTWNLALTTDDVANDVHIVAIVDPDATIPVLDRSDSRYPRGDGIASLDVRSLHPFRIVVFPVEANDRTPRITPENLQTYLTPVRQWIPSSTVEATLRLPFSSGRDLTTGAGWSGLLSDLQAIRVAESAADEYYHAIVPDVPGSSIAGIAYVPASPASPFRSGVTFDRLPAAAEVLAHELGHNLGRSHAPSPGCQTPAGIDPNFPHVDGGVGWPAFDILSGQFLHSGFKDYMGYCSEVWTSDYTYAGILAWRRTDPLVPGNAAMAAGTATTGVAGSPGAMTSRAARSRPTPGLLLWGTIGAAGLTLNPAFELSAVPALPETSGPYTVRGSAADGSEVFRLSFAGTPVAHAEDPDEAHFAFFVPLDARAIRSVQRIEVSGPRGVATRVSGHGPASDPEVTVRLAGPGRLRIDWPAERGHAALVRDPATGRILAIAREGETRFAGEALGSDQLEVIVSDGVASRRARLR